jgi:hypothetical protein
MASTLSSAEVTMPSSGWRDILIRAAKVAVIGFIVLQAKELVDAGMLDTKATAVDAVLIAAGVLLYDAILKWASPRR